MKKTSYHHTNKTNQKQKQTKDKQISKPDLLLDYHKSDVLKYVFKKVIKSNVYY